MNHDRVAAFSFGPHQLELHADRCAWHASLRTLFVSDLHWGKETTFQRSGIPVPSHVLAEGLARLSALLDMYQPSQVVVLGDLLHAPSGIGNNLLRTVGAFWNEQSLRRPGCRWWLVEGNHDRRVRSVLAHWPITLVEPPWMYENIVCVHDPDLPLPDSIGSSDDLILAGHLHPAFRMPDNGEKLCCFAQRGRCLIFPAFGDFTGRKPMDIGGLNQVYVIRDRMLARLELKTVR